MGRKSIKDRIVQRLEELEVGDKIGKKGFIIEIYGEEGYFITRAFDANLCYAKKTFPEKEFESNKKGVIKRIK